MRRFCLLFVLLMAVSYSVDSWAWDDKKTHRDLSEKAGRHSILSSAKGDYLQNLGFSKNIEELFTLDGDKWEVWRWLRYGGLMEDESLNILGIKIEPIGRFYNHFHNPLKPWDQAGLDSIVNGESALLWAQDDVENDEWAWQKVREYYRLALTAPSETDRSANFAKTFRGLGQAIHLIEDMAQPAHVRNDAHPEDNKGIRPGFEWWAKQNDSLMKSYMSAPILPDVPLNVIKNGRLPISQFWDTDQYSGTGGPLPSTSIGLAEYTNANFFSEDTIFDANFPYPSQAQTTTKQIALIAEDGQTDLPWYAVRTGTDDVVAVYSYLEEYLRDMEGYGSDVVRGEWKYLLDDAVYAAYAKHLIPRAVGYSAGLINYFFRGQMETTALEKLDENGNVTELLINVKNTTPNETMKDGFFTLAYLYNKPTGWGDLHGYGAIKNPSGEIAFNGSKQLSFVLTNPIPFDATDKQYTLVFHDGTLGAEVGAVVGKVVKVVPDAIAITAPERFVYAIADDGLPSKSFAKLRMRLRDNAPIIAMTGGSVTATARYKIHLNHTDDLANEPPDGFERSETFTTVASLPVAVALDAVNPTELEFDFSANPIPFGVTDLTLEVAYKQGDAVIAIGTKDLNEPQYVGVWNAHDRFLLDRDLNSSDAVHDWRLMTQDEIMNDPALVGRLDTDGNGLIDEIIDPVDIDVDVAFVGNAEDVSPENYQASYSHIPAGRFGRLAFIADQSPVFALFHDRYTSSLPDSSASGDYLKFDGIGRYFFPGVTNQQGGETYNYTPIYLFRGIKNHFSYTSVGLFPKPSNSTEEGMAIMEANWPAPASTAPVPAATINP